MRLGEFAPLNEEVIIRREDVRRAIGRVVNDEYTNTVHFGIDVSSGDSNDYTVISIRRGNKELERLKIKRKLRELYDEIIRMIKRYRYTCENVIVNIDTTGLGIQLGQDLYDYYYHDDHIEINEMNFSHKAVLQKQFSNGFTEMFFYLKEVIDKISLLPIVDSVIEEDLGARRYGYDIQNRYCAERKKEFIKRFKRSPDEGDAVLLAFYDQRDVRVLETMYFGGDDW